MKKYFAFMALALCLFVFGSAQAASQASQPIGQVVWVKGTVKDVSTAYGSRVLKRRDAIYVNDQIDTDDSSSGEIVFTDGQLLTVTPGSSMHMSQYNFSKENPPSNKFVTDIVKGGFRAITGAISKANPEGYKVNTPVATIGVRGTDFKLFYKQCSGQSHGKQCGLSAAIVYGSISVSNATGDVVLTQGTNSQYASVTSSSQAPGITAQPSNDLSVTINVVPATFGDPSLGSPITPGGPGSSGGGATGPAKQVGGFCIQ